MSKWIKCSERMPGPFSHVLVTDGEEVEIKWFDDDSDEWDSWDEFNSNIDNEDITHWRELSYLNYLIKINVDDVQGIAYSYSHSRTLIKNVK